MINFVSIVLIILTILLIYCYCNKEPFRPKHPKWYTDIPETHPEVLDLIKQTEAQSKRVQTYTKTGFKKIKTPPEIQAYLLNIAKTTNRVPEQNNNIFRRTSSGLPQCYLSLAMSGFIILLYIVYRKSSKEI